MPKWSQVTVESARSLADDPSTSRRTCSRIIGSRLINHTICDDPQIFAAATCHLEWDSAMEEEYSSLMSNHTWDLCTLPKGRKLV